MGDHLVRRRLPVGVSRTRRPPSPHPPPPRRGLPVVTRSRRHTLAWREPAGCPDSSAPRSGGRARNLCHGLGSLDRRGRARLQCLVEMLAVLVGAALSRTRGGSDGSTLGAAGGSPCRGGRRPQRGQSHAPNREAGLCRSSARLCALGTKRDVHPGFDAPAASPIGPHPRATHDALPPAHVYLPCQAKQRGRRDPRRPDHTNLPRWLSSRLRSATELPQRAGQASAEHADRRHPCPLQQDSRVEQAVIPGVPGADLYRFH